MDVQTRIGLNVARARRERGMSQEDLSFGSGLTRAYLSGLEAGRRNPTVASLEKIAQALSIDIEDLVRAPHRG